MKYSTEFLQALIYLKKKKKSPVMLRRPRLAPDERTHRARAVTANEDALMLPGLEVDAILDNLNNPYTLII